MHISGEFQVACTLLLQISETELEQIARMTADGGSVYEGEDGAGGDATRQLLGAYGPTPSRCVAALPGSETSSSDAFHAMSSKSSRPLGRICKCQV